MSTLANLYQEVILDHNHSPRNCGELQCPNRVVFCTPHTPRL